MSQREQDPPFPVFGDQASIPPIPSVFGDLQCQGQRVQLDYSHKVKDDTSVKLQGKWWNLK